jgi:predicted component of type VI protein secretion system
MGGMEAPVAAHLSLARPVLQTRSVQRTAILPQLRRSPAQPEARPGVPGSAAPGGAVRPSSTLPRPSSAGPASAVQPPAQPPVQPAPQAAIQRQPTVPGAALTISRAEVGEAADVQRAEDEGVEPGVEARDEEQDLDRLAREVYPLVKRLLAVERERLTGRWR